MSRAQNRQAEIAIETVGAAEWFAKFAPLHMTQATATQKFRGSLAGILFRPERLAGKVLPRARDCERFDVAVRAPGRGILEALEHPSVIAMLEPGVIKAYRKRAELLVNA